MDKKIITTCIIVIAFTCGFIFKSLSRQEVAPQADTQYQEKYENLKARLEKIHQIDMEEYFQLKDQKEKYEKADEILGKILLLILADLGIKISQDQIQFAKSALGPKVVSENQVPVAAPLVEKPTAKVLQPLPQRREWFKNEAILSSVRSTSEVEEAIKATEITDFFAALKTTKPLGIDEAQKLNGQFEGTINLDSPPATWVVNLELETTSSHSSGGFEGKSKISLAELDGEPFSTSSGDGQQDSFTKAANSQAIFLKVRAKNKESYLQLYVVDSGKKLIGNYYEQLSIDSYKKAGTVTMNRK